MKKWAKRGGRLVAGLVGLGALAFGLMQTSPAKAWLANRLSTALSNEARQVSIDGITGLLPFSLAVAQVRIADGQGDWLVLEEGSLEWSAGALRRRTLLVPTLTVSRFEVVRRPSTGGGSAPAVPPAAPATPGALPALEVTSFVVDRLELGEDVIGQAGSFHVEGGLTASPGWQDLSSTLVLTEPGHASLKIDAGFKRSSSALRLKARLRADPGSVVVALLPLSEEDTLEVSLSGAGPLTDWAGRVVVDASRTGRLAGELGWTVDTAMTFQFHGQVDPRLDALTPYASTAEVALQGTRTGEGELVVEMFSVETTLATLAASGRLHPDTQAGVATLRLSIPALQQLPAPGVAGLGGRGVIEAEVRFDGNHQTIDADVRAEVDEVVGLPSMATDVMGRSLTMKGEVSYAKPHGVQVPRIELRGGPVSIAGSGEIDPADGRYAANWEASVATLDLLAPHLSGMTGGALHSQGSCRGNGAEVELQTRTRVEDLRVKQLRLDQLLVDAIIQLPVSNLTGTIALHADVNEETVSMSTALARSEEGWRMEAIQARLPGATVDGQLHILPDVSLAEGDLRAVLTDLSAVNGWTGSSLEGTGQMALRLEATETGQSVRLAATLRNLVTPLGSLGGIALSAEGEDVFGGRILRANLDVAEGRGQARVVVRGEELEGTVRVKALPWSALPLSIPEGISATLDGELDLSGRLSAPIFQLSAGAQGEWRETRPDHIEPPVAFSVSVDAKSGAGQCRGTGIVTSEGLGEVRAEAHLPMEWSLLPWKLRIGSAESAAVSATGTIDLSVLTSLISLDPHLVAGMVTADLQCEGLPPAGAMTGVCTLTDGSYQHLIHGVVLQDVDLRLEGVGRQVLSLAGSATDGASGRVTVKGALDLLPEVGFPVRARVETRAANLLQSDAASATVSGVVGLAGSLHHPSVTGHIDVVESTIWLGENGLYHPPHLPVVERGGAQEASAPEKPARPGKTSALQADIGIRFAGPCVVQGRNMSSTWGGGVRVVKSPDTGVSVRGALRSRRGEFSLFGRRFTLSDSTITLAGGEILDPLLNLTAQHRRPKMTALLHVTGRATQPEIALTSDPVLPQDEILSQVLFGRSATTITPFQALRLAAALRELRGRGGPSLGLLDRASRLAGVDFVDVRASETVEDRTEVVAGRQLTDRVLVEAATPIGGDDRGTVRVEIELSPSFTIETEAGASIRPGIGFNWRRQY